MHKINHTTFYNAGYCMRVTCMTAVRCAIRDSIEIPLENYSWNSKESSLCYSLNNLIEDSIEDYFKTKCTDH